MTDEELIIEVKEGNCSNSFLELSLRHQNLFYKVCQKYASVAKASFQDLLEDKNFIIYRSILSYDNTRKTKFSTWLGNYTRYYCLNFLNANCKYLTFEDKDIESFVEKFENEINPDKDSEEYSKLFFENCFGILSRLKDKRIHTVYQKRYSSQKKRTWAAIAEEMRISTQTVINLHNRGKKVLRNKMKTQKYLNTI